MVRLRVTPTLEKQWGVVTRAQLLELGVSVAAIEKQVTRGDLMRVHRGVYALPGVPLRDEGHWLAAVLACGPGAVLSHLSAARLWGMRAPRGDGRPHVTLAAGRARPPGIAVHRTRRISRADVTVERGIRVTTAARTVIDVADITTYDELRTLADHGVRLDAEAIERAQARAPGRHGAPHIARLLGSGIRTRSTLERALRKLVRTTPLPTPEFNAKVLGRERDAVWRARSGSWPRSTATARTPPASHGRTTTRATRRSSPPAGVSCASPTPRSSTSPSSWRRASPRCLGSRSSAGAACAARP